MIKTIVGYTGRVQETTKEIKVIKRNTNHAVRILRNNLIHVLTNMNIRSESVRRHPILKPYWIGGI